MLRPALALILLVAAHPPGADRRPAGTDALETMRRRACALRDDARYAESEALLRRVLSLAAQDCTGCVDEILTAENDLGVLYKYMGRFDDAARAYSLALDLARRTHHRDDAVMATLYHNLGGLEHARERYAAGEPFARRAVAIREKLLGPGHPDVADDLAALAPILDAQGKRREAAAMLLRALAILERAYGPESCRLAVSLNNLAALRFAEGNRTAALPLYYRTLAIKNRCLGRDHPDVATTLNTMAVLLKSQGDRQAAARLYAQALAIFEKSLGPSHPKTVACRVNYDRLRQSP